jgi:hypothetical protein
VTPIPAKLQNGVVKKGSLQLSTEEQTKELSMLNPMGTSTRAVLAPVCCNKNGFISTRSMKMVPSADLHEEDDVPVEGNKCTNSTGTFVPPYWTFVFSDIDLRDHMCVSVNMPRGLCDKQFSLEGKVEAIVAPCGTKLLIACEWTETLTTAHCMEDALSVQWSLMEKNKCKFAASASTVANILHAFQKELHKICVASKCTSNNSLGAKATIELPFQVEPEMVLCEPCLDSHHGSVTLYVVVWKIMNQKDIHPTNKMSVRVFNGMAKSTDQRFKQLPGYYSSDDDSKGPGYKYNKYPKEY